MHPKIPILRPPRLIMIQEPEDSKESEFKEQLIDVIEQRCLKIQPFKDLICSIHIIITMNPSFTLSLNFSSYSAANISYLLSASNQKHTMEIPIQTAPSAVIKENLLNQLFSRSFAITHFSAVEAYMLHTVMKDITRCVKKPCEHQCDCVFLSEPDTVCAQF